jgi:hypothetical protein
VSGFALERRCIPFDQVRKLVVSTPRQIGGEFSAKSGNLVGEKEAFGAMFGRSLSGSEEAEIIKRMTRKVAERCQETADAGS